MQSVGTQFLGFTYVNRECTPTLTDRGGVEIYMDGKNDLKERAPGKPIALKLQRTQLISISHPATSTYFPSGCVWRRSNKESWTLALFRP